MKPILEIQKISKKFKIRHEQQVDYLSLRDAMTSFFSKDSSQKSEDFFALKNISFDVYPGESVGIVGKNGAGKSTLLKILSKITPPSSGKIVSRGRMASLLEVGTGFHAELDGRENIFLNGSILGLKRKEIQNKFDEIVDFSGVEKFLDTPLKHYSSGMQLRLAFAVAAFLEPEILVIDEVLAVGDVEFQKKCMGKMEEVSKSGRTILFVSHNMGAIQELCSRCILIEKGNLTFSGTTNDTIDKYLGINNPDELGVSYSQLKKENSLCFISDISLFDGERKIKNIFDMSDEINVCLKYKLIENSNNFDVSIIVARNGVDVFFSIDTDQITFEKREQGNYSAAIKIPKQFLKEGFYSISVYFRNPLNGSHYNVYKNVVKFEIQSNYINTSNKGYHKDRQGYVIFPGQWSVVKEQ